MENKIKNELPVVAIVGRPNVGKSFLFNRLAGKAVSLVDDEPGVTRDRLYAEVRSGDKVFSLVDTGGFYPGRGGLFSMIEKQVEFSIKEASVIIWVLDIKDGVTAVDEDIAEKLRHFKKTVILALNKADNPSLMEDTGDFYRLGFGEPVPISAFHGLNTDTLLDRVTFSIPTARGKAAPKAIQISVVGRPNVGKSSFINALLKDERVMVDAQPGTTRGVIPIPFHFEENAFTLLDTSGLRKRYNIDTELEKKMSIWTMRVIRRSHVSILLIDAYEGVTSQDARISDYIWENNRGLVIVFNKWDLILRRRSVSTLSESNGLIKDDGRLRMEYLEALHSKLRVSKFCPVVFASALLGENVFKTLSLARAVFDRSRMRIQTHVLNEIIEEAVRRREAQYVRGKHLKVFYATQADVEPPTFIFFVNDASLVRESYKRYLMNVIYDNIDFSGTPIRIFFRSRR